MSFLSTIEKWLVIRDETLSGRYDFVLAIGIDVNPKGTGPSPQSAACARKTLELYQSMANNVLLVGGYRATPEGLTESETMAKEISNSVDVGYLFLETESNRTWLNAICSLAIIQKQGWRKGIIVAQQWHARRVRATFKKRWEDSGIEFVVVKAKSPYGGGSQKRLNSFPSFVFWDTVAFIYSKLKGLA